MLSEKCSGQKIVTHFNKYKYMTTDTFYNLWRETLKYYPEVPLDLFEQEKFKSFAERMHSEVDKMLDMEYNSGLRIGKAEGFTQGYDACLRKHKLVEEVRKDVDTPPKS